MATIASEPRYGILGLSEQELRRALEQELEQAAGVERDLSTHAIAHSVARVLELDHQRVAEQLARSGIELVDSADAR